MPRRECFLYMTDDCALCDEALTMLLESNALRGVVLTSVDVATNDDLFESFGESIPVLAYLGKSLTWPFSVEEAIELLNSG
ncbi:MAG: glutaredoxin family protein [Gammaproteobacteria bacterium]|nr:glutaredoxin family protein [Gammaproteobacteria bacterium]